MTSPFGGFLTTLTKDIPITLDRFNRTIKVHIAGIDPRTLLLLTLWSTCGATDAAVHLSRLTAATVTLVIHRHLQAIFEAHWLDGEAVVGTMWRAASRFHTHVKWNLMKKAVKKLRLFPPSPMVCSAICPFCAATQLVRTPFVNVNIVFKSENKAC